MSDSEKIQDLEIAMAHQDKVINELSDVMNAQWKEIESLKRKLMETNNKIDELESNSGGDDQSNVKPPHW